MFEVTYIYHDCFLITTPDCALLFDFWKDPAVRDGELPEFLRTLRADIPLYVFVSHFHKDHFNKVIFSWVDVHPDIHFIISKDTARHAGYLLRDESLYRGPKPDVSLVSVLRPGDSFADEKMTVRAFGSTDVGNSYAITLMESGLTIFHAGDLNCWAWRDESTSEEIAAAEQAFENELRPLAEAFPKLDIAMFPVDSRIGSGYADGASRFVRAMRVKHFFPMHFELADTPEQLAQRKRDAIDFKAYAASEGQYIALTSRGDCFSEEDKKNNEAESKFNPVLTREYFLSAGETNAEREISLPLLTSKLIDIATEHANHLEIGNPFMPNNHTGWVLSRLTIEMKQYPTVDSRYKISTWIESCNRHFSERAFSIEDEAGNPLGYARSIWMVLDTVTHANAGLDSLNVREEFIGGRECPPIKRQGKHLTIVSPEEADSATGRFLVADSQPEKYTFKYSDLDAYRHVNTVRYVSLLMNRFSLQEHDEYRIGRLELSFLHEGQYGKTLDILRAPIKAENEDSRGYAFQLRREEDKQPILFSRLWLDKRDSPIPTL